MGLRALKRRSREAAYARPRGRAAHRRYAPLSGWGLMLPPATSLPREPTQTCSPYRLRRATSAALLLPTGG